MSEDLFRSPLEQIEQAVLARAKHLSIDLDAGAGAAELALLVNDEINQWNLDFRRGLRPFELTNPELVAERAYRNLIGYGPLGPLLDDEDVWEIMVNAPDGTFG